MQPEKKFAAGAIVATVWDNEVNTSTGVAHFKAVSLARNYKDKDGQWKSTNSYRSMDLPKAVLVLQKAFEYVALNEKEESPSAGKSTPTRSSTGVEEEVLF